MSGLGLRGGLHSSFGGGGVFCLGWFFFFFVLSLFGDLWVWGLIKEGGGRGLLGGVCVGIFYWYRWGWGVSRGGEDKGWGVRE